MSAFYIYIIQQQYHVALVSLGWVGLKWEFGDEQAEPCMGWCMGAWELNVVTWLMMKLTHLYLVNQLVSNENNTNNTFTYIMNVILGR